MNMPATIRDEGTDQTMQFRSVSLRLEKLFGIVTNPDKRRTLLPVLSTLIMNQAAMHGKDFVADSNDLGESIRDLSNTFRGLVIYANERTPVAYAIYYPKMDSKGERGIYIEDAYATESMRGCGVMTTVFNMLAQFAVEEGASHMEWATDGRNAAFKKFMDKIGAHASDVITLDADKFLQLSGKKENEKLIIEPIAPNHISDIEQLGLSGNLIRNNGDIDFRGFICFDKNRTPLAIVPGWNHLSTFRLGHGIYLENPTFSPTCNADKKEKILHAIQRAATSYCEDKGKTGVRWHVKNDDQRVLRVLCDDFGLTEEQMLDDDPQSVMRVFRLSNGNMAQLAARKPEMEIKMPLGARIGPEDRAPN